MAEPLENKNDFNVVKSNFDSSQNNKEADQKKTRAARIRINENVNKLINTPIYDQELRKYIYNGLAQNVRIELEKRNISILELSDLAGVTYSHLNKFLKNEHQIGLNVLINIAYALELSPADLFPYDSNQRKSNGARFDDLTRECDLKTVNMILGIVADIVKDSRRVKHSI